MIRNLLQTLVKSRCNARGVILVSEEVDVRSYGNFCNRGEISIQGLSNPRKVLLNRKSVVFMILDVISFVRKALGTNNPFRASLLHTDDDSLLGVFFAKDLRSWWLLAL